MSGTVRESGLDADTGFLNSIAHPKQANYLDITSGAADTAGKIWQNRQWQARQAVGEAYQGATNPTTGQIDLAAAQRQISQNPAAALEAEGTATRGTELANKQLGLNGAQMALAGRQVGSVLALPDDQQTPENYRAALDNALAHGAITKEHHDAAVANLPTSGGPQAMRNYGTRLLVGTLAGPDVANHVLPKYQQTDTGGEIQPQVQYPATTGKGVGALPGGQQKTTGPDYGGNLVETTVTLKDGTERKVLVPRDTLPNNNAPPGRGGQPPALPSGRFPTKLNPSGTPPPAVGGGGPQPAVPAQPAAPAQPATPAQPASPAPATPAPIYSGLPPGQEDQQKANVRDYQTAVTNMPDQRKSVNAGETALEALRLAKTGPGQGWIQKYNALAQSYGLPPATGSDPAAYQIAQKNLIRFAQSQSKASGTDLGLETQLAANANVDHMLQSASEHVVVQDLGLARQRIAQTMEAPDKGNNYGEHVKTFTGQTDPRGFAWDLYTPEQRATILAEARKTKGGEEKLNRAIELADKYGLIKVPNARQAKPAAAPPPPQPNLLAPP